MTDARVELRVVEGGDIEPRTLTPERPLIRIGRGEQAQWRFPDDQRMSRVHAEVELIEDTVLLRNLSSKGTELGSRRLKSICELADGSVFRCGGTRFELQWSGLDASASSDTIAVLGESASALDRSGTRVVAPLEPDEDEPATIVAGEVLRSSLLGQALRGRLDAGHGRFLLVMALLGGASWTAAGIGPLRKLARDPALLGEAIVFALVTMLPGLLLFKLIDLNGQVPLLDYLGAWIWGATVSAGGALLFNSSSAQLLESLSGTPMKAVSLVVFAPATEEVLKGFGVLMLFLLLRDLFETTLAGLVLGAATGLGFAFSENVFYNTRFLHTGGHEELLIWGGARAAVTTVFGHPIYSGFLGAAFGLSRARADRRAQVLIPFLGLLVAVGIHMSWNGALLIGNQISDDEMQALIVTTPILGGLGLTLFASLFLWATARERRILERGLAGEIRPGFVTAEEFEAFRRAGGRLRYECAGLLRGATAWRLRRRLRRAQVALAFRKWTLHRQGAATTGDALLQDARLRITSARAALTRLERPRR